jgi:cytochrome c peroxidase
MRRLPPTVLLALLTTLLLIAPALAGGLDHKERLGKQLFFDATLSEPDGQACADCHHPSAGFADPEQSLPVSEGVIPGLFGNRNSPTAAYAALGPNLGYDPLLPGHPEGHRQPGPYFGGQFWDGRATDLMEQAKGPFLNPLEMNNPSKETVVRDVRKAKYAKLFQKVFGPDSLDDVDLAYDYIAEAIAAYETSAEVNPFSSKYDAYLAGKAALTVEEAWGLELFNSKGDCYECHTAEPGPYHDKPLFTDYTYENIGVPKNWANPFLYLPAQFNPAGPDYVDYGLGGVLDDPAEYGKFKVPTLRNVAVTAPYMHNGIFRTLHEVVDFYNTAGIEGRWPEPEVGVNLNRDDLGDLELTAAEVDALVAFMHTLTDGWKPGVRMQKGR